MQEENLTDDNFMVQCAKHYRVQCVTTDEFLSDVKRLKYIKKLLTRYSTTKIIDERLILNHLTVLLNVFGGKFLCRMLFLKLYSNMNCIKPFLLFLNIFPAIVTNVNGNNYDTKSIEMDWNVVEKLETIIKQYNK